MAMDSLLESHDSGQMEWEDWKRRPRHLQRFHRRVDVEGLYVTAYKNVVGAFYVEDSGGERGFLKKRNAEIQVPRPMILKEEFKKMHNLTIEICMEIQKHWTFEVTRSIIDYGSLPFAPEERCSTSLAHAQSANSQD